MQTRSRSSNLSLNRSIARNLALAALLVAPMVFAQAVDPGAAREQLKQGYALKQQGKFAEALPHLLESLRLDPQLKTMMNLADAEEHIGKLVDATRHWVQARDKAASAGDDGARVEAAKRLTAAEARTPKLTIVLKGVDASAATVKRDAVVLGAVSLGEALPSDPGAHVILVEAAGYESRTFDVTLKESESQKVEVSPGPKTAAAPVPVQATAKTVAPSASAAPTAADPASAAPATSDTGSSDGRTQRIAGLAAAGVGGVLIAVSLGEYASAKSKHNDALAGCTTTSCSADALSSQDDSKSAAKTGNVLLIVGAVLAVGGGLTAFAAPRGTGDSSAFSIAPPIGKTPGGISWRGTF